ncbi:MAG TPA: pseudouridine synthase [Planctomycetaceae bacterium]|nr:pseudouridine synthase [Planctomycetaceae bacterium]
MSDRSTTTNSMRLQRFLAASGIASRRQCEELITSGHVEVDGKIATELGFRIDPDKNEVRVDTEIVKLKPKRYYILNKPKGVLCTHRDPGRRRLAVDLIPGESEHLFTVGRLDENSEGLLLVTNDGDLSQRLQHPKYRVLRTYRVQVAGEPTREVYQKLREGLFFKEGKFKVHHAKKIKKQGKSTILEIQLSEGKNREVRRLLARVGHKVMNLQRVGFGPIRLGKLAVGESRPLTTSEREQLLEFAFSTPGKESPANQKHRVRPRSARRSPRTPTNRKPQG